jgi:hypothetical protein
VFPHHRAFLAATFAAGLTVGLAAGCTVSPASPDAAAPGLSAGAPGFPASGSPGFPAGSAPGLPGGGSTAGGPGFSAGSSPGAPADGSTAGAPGGGSPGGAAVGGGGGGFTATDNAWIEVNIAMNEQILPLLALAPDHGANAQLKALSADLANRFTTELADLRRLHAEAGLPAENPHLGMPMPGMVTPEQLAAAAGKRGAEFDAVLHECVKAHGTQGETLLSSLLKLTSPQQVVDVANRMKSNREYIRYTLADIPA